MTVVVADTSPINYLVPIGEIEILRRLYHRIVIPEEVFAELTHEGAPRRLRRWAMALHDWLEIRQAAYRDLSKADLDAGEASAIALAEMEADVLLPIDESEGRREATRRGYPKHWNAGIVASRRNRASR